MARAVVLVCGLLAVATVVEADVLNFLAMGDWGGQDGKPYYTKGEHDCASAMGQVAASTNPQFAVGLGDNFYSSGIHGDGHDPRFQETFEDVFNASSLENIPFYMIAGNHDHKGNVTAQIEYTKYSTRWKYPDQWFSVRQSFSDGKGGQVTFELHLIDTVTISGNTDLNEDPFAPPPGAADPVLAETQWQWIEDQLANSTADYLWVGGHYPVWSACSHGPTSNLVNRLKPLLEKYNATGYMCGHDHCLEYIDEGKGPVYVVTGSGKECCYDDSNYDKNPSGSIKFLVAEGSHSPKPTMDAGFTLFHVEADFMQVTYYNNTAGVLYQTPQLAPRRKN